MSIHSIDAPAGFRKEIVYDRETRDYAMYLNGELVGFAHTYHQAEVELDERVYELLRSGLHRTATELDGGTDPDETAAAVNWSSAPERCTPDVQGRYWTVCGGPCDEPCMCDVVVRAACRESGESTPLTLPQAVALACGEPEPAPQGPEEQTNWGGWRAPLWMSR